VWWRNSALLLWAAALPALAGPVEFGRAELNRALAERRMDPARFRVRTEVSSDAPESYRILPGLITGGDLRGVMYGLLEAADQIRLRGYLAQARGTPATPIRGIRHFVHNQDLDQAWYYSREYWRDFFALLARCRFNRFNLVFAHQTAYLAPPYPFWVALEDYPQIRVPGLTEAERERNLETLRFISDTAAEHGIDFTLGIWEHNIQMGMKPSVEGLTRRNIGPYSYAALRRVLAACPSIRGVQLRTNSESGIPADQQVEFYRDHVFRAIRDAGRRVVLDLRGWVMAGGMIEAARDAGVPPRLSSKYWAEDLGRPYQPAETYPSYSFLNFLEKQRPCDFYWEVWGLGSHRLLLWGDPGFVRRMVPTFTLSGTQGFEIDAPLAQKGFGNRPGQWGVFTAAHQDRVFWKWEFERYWLFYLLWGRLSYDPKTPETVWTRELRARFGAAGPDMLEAYRAASGVLNEIVAAHLADPNMYIWPEINPGGLIDAYKDVRSSDWRFVASPAEAARDRARGVATARQTPEQTAQRLRELATAAEKALAAARAKVSPGHQEWRSSEADLSVLVRLARYHAHKQIAAERLAWFHETADAAALAAARSELEAALKVWEDLVRLTGGLYPAEMAFGPDDVGHWADKLPYVRHDLALLEERERVWRQFGRFAFGFDFGGPVATRRGASYRTDPYVLRNTVEPRFELVEAGTKFTESAGYGWISDGERAAHALPLTPYHEVRAVARNPQNLPRNVLFGDWIRGRGAQTFRVRTGEGDFTALFLHPDGSTTSQKPRARDGHLDVVFPAGEWTASGLVIKAAREAPDPPAARRARPVPPPKITHLPPKSAVAGSPLQLSLSVVPSTAARIVRLHYRPVNQLVPFKTLEAPAARRVFTIPAEDISPRWDLMYYFEVLAADGSGWFHPDPAVATPYYVVTVNAGGR